MIDLTKGRAPSRVSTLARVFAPFVAVVVPGFSCSGEPYEPDGPRLVVLYSTCTLNNEFLSPYAPDVRYTPNLQALADAGLVFRRHVTECGQSGVAFASIYAGAQADRHGIFHHPKVLSDELYLVSEAFADNGFETYFWSGHPMAAAELGYGQGVPEENVFHRHVMFTRHAKVLGDDFLVGVTANGPELDGILAGLAADRERRAYLQINFTITHELYHEYASPDRIQAFRERFPEAAGPWSRAEVDATLAFFEENRHPLQLNHREAVARLGLSAADVERIDGVLRLAYAACVAQLDEYLGRFLDRIERAGLRDESLIAFTADHGETFHHESQLFHWMHGLGLAPTVLHVPLIVRAPKLEPGSHDGVTRSIDVFPTLAELCGLALPADADLAGKSLAPAIAGREPAPHLWAYSHTSTLGPERVRRYRREKLTTAATVLPEAHPRHMWVSVRDVDRVYKLRVDEEGEWRTVAHDLASDPYEAVDVFDPERPGHREMADRLHAYKQRLTAAFEGFASREQEGDGLSQKQILETLKSLGYVGEGDDESEDDAADGGGASTGG